MEDIVLLLSKCTQCDDTNDEVPGQTFPIVETPTSKIFAEIAAYLDAIPGAPGNAAEASKDSESDSVVTPDATTPSAESGGESAPSVYPPVRSSARYKRLKGRKKYSFQAFRSPFLEGNSFSATLPSFNTRSLFSNIQREANLKNQAVGGFLKCVQLWQRVEERRCFPASSLPAQYMDEDEPLSPLSEGDETSNEDGIKVVGNDFFVKSTKRKKKRPPTQGRVPPSPRSPAGVCRPAPAQAARRRRSSSSSSRAEGGRQREPRPVDVSGSRAKKKRPGSPPRPGPEEEEEEVTECTGDSPALEEPGGPVLQEDSGPDVVRRVAADVADGRENVVDDDDDDERRRKRKKRKKEKQRDVRVVEEEASVSVDEPCPALRTPDTSQPTSGSTMTLSSSSSNKHGSDGLVDQVDDRWAPKKQSKKKKKKKKKEEEPRTDVAEEEVNDVDAVTGAPTETTPGGFKAAGFKAASETADVSRRTSGSTVTFIHNQHDDDGGDDDERHQRKKRRKEKKRKVEEEVTTSLDGRRPAAETGDVSPRTSTVTINDNGQSLEGPVDQSEDQCTPRKKKKKKKKRRTSVVVTEEEVNSADTVTAHETSAPAETTPGGFKKPKKKKKRQKTAAFPEDDTSPVEENAGGEGSPFAPPAGREVERPRKKKRKKQEVAEASPRAGPEDTLGEGDGLTLVRKKKKKNKEAPPFLTE